MGETPEFRGVGLRWFLHALRALAIALPLLVAFGSATGAIRLGIGSRSAVVSGAGLVVPSPLVTLFALAVAALLFVSFFTPRAEVSVDEGGIRWRRGRRRGYVPFSHVRDVSARGRMLVVETTEGRLRFAIGNAPFLDVVGSVMKKLRRAALPERPEETALLARRGRDLAAWLDATRVATQIDGGDAYRVSPTQAEALEDVATDENRDPDLRAAATYALLGRGDDALTARITTQLGANSPPIVIAAAALAAPGRVDSTWVDEAATFLDVRDRRALAEATAHAKVGSGPHVRIDVPAPASDDEVTAEEAEPLRRKV